MSVGTADVGFLNSVDWYSDAPESAARRLVELLQLPPIRSSWRFALSEHGFDAVFFRAGERMTAAPTKLEFITSAAPEDTAAGCSVAPIAGIDQLQVGRPQRTHATNLLVSDFEAVLGHLRDRQIPVFVETVCEHLAFPRAWIGWDDTGTRWTPGFDAGTYLEIMPLDAVPSVIAESVSDPEQLSGASRAGTRTLLVTDLDSAVRELEGTLGLVPEPVRADQLLGLRAATYPFRHPGSATLTLAEPAGRGPGSEYLEKYGEGLFVTSILFTDPDAAVEHALGLGAEIVVDGRKDHGRAVIADPLLPGILLEIRPQRA